MERNICDSNKVGFTTHKEAASQIKSLVKKLPKHKFRAYKCKNCGDFHITTVTKNKMWTPKKLDKYPIRWRHPNIEPDPPKKKGKHKK